MGDRMFTGQDVETLRRQLNDYRRSIEGQLSALKSALAVVDTDTDTTLAMSALEDEVLVADAAGGLEGHAGLTYDEATLYVLGLDVAGNAQVDGDLQLGGDITANGEINGTLVPVIASRNAAGDTAPVDLSVGSGTFNTNTMKGWVAPCGGSIAGFVWRFKSTVNLATADIYCYVYIYEHREGQTSHTLKSTIVNAKHRVDVGDVNNSWHETIGWFPRNTTDNGFGQTLCFNAGDFLRFRTQGVTANSTCGFPWLTMLVYLDT